MPIRSKISFRHTTVTKPEPYCHAPASAPHTADTNPRHLSRLVYMPCRMASLHPRRTLLATHIAVVFHRSWRRAARRDSMAQEIGLRLRPHRADVVSLLLLQHLCAEISLYHHRPARQSSTAMAPQAHQRLRTRRHHSGCAHLRPHVVGGACQQVPHRSKRD